MRPVLIIKNISHEGPDILGEVLQTAGIPMDIRDLEASDTFPDPCDFAALIVMGGPDSANDDTPKMQQELEHLRKAIRAGVPYFGVCLGLQVVVKAMGGSIVKNPVREIGAKDPEGAPYTVNITEAGKRDPLLHRVDDPLPMFHLHGETVTLTPQMTLLGTGTWCQHQIVRIADRAYGIQGHLEVTQEALELWCTKDDWLRAMETADLKRDWQEYSASYRKNCEQIFHNFLSIAGVG
jgi:GMP synthase-like glutamine amidotransferase